MVGLLVVFEGKSSYLFGTLIVAWG